MLLQRQEQNLNWGRTNEYHDKDRGIEEGAHKKKIQALESDAKLNNRLSNQAST